MSSSESDQESDQENEGKENAQEHVQILTRKGFTHIKQVLAVLEENVDNLDISFNSLGVIRDLPQSIHSLNLESNQICRLDSLPRNLKILKINSNPISKLKTLPSSLEQLFFDNTQVRSLIGVPNAIKIVHCHANPHLKTLMGLPVTIVELFCYSCPRLKLDYLTQSPQTFSNLKFLDIAEVGLRTLPTFPPNLQYLNVSQNLIGHLDGVPATLTQLSCQACGLTGVLDASRFKFLRAFCCSTNDLSTLINLPSTLKSLHINSCGMTVITLPPSLKHLECIRNRLQTLDLPPFLHALNCWGNPWTSPFSLIPRTLTELLIEDDLKLVDNLDQTWYDRAAGDAPPKLKMKDYHLITRLQRRVRFRIKYRNKMARIIQRNCHNWLHQAYCADGTVGINVKLDLKKLKKEGIHLDGLPNW